MRVLTVALLLFFINFSQLWAAGGEHGTCGYLFSHVVRHDGMRKMSEFRQEFLSAMAKEEGAVIFKDQSTAHYVAVVRQPEVTSLIDAYKSLGGSEMGDGTQMIVAPLPDLKSSPREPNKKDLNFKRNLEIRGVLGAVTSGVLLNEFLMEYLEVKNFPLSILSGFVTTIISFELIRPFLDFYLKLYVHKEIEVIFNQHLNLVEEWDRGVDDPKFIYSILESMGKIRMLSSAGHTVFSVIEYAGNPNAVTEALDMLGYIPVNQANN